MTVWHTCGLSGPSAALCLSISKSKHHLADLAGKSEVLVLVDTWQIVRSIDVEWVGPCVFVLLTFLKHLRTYYRYKLEYNWVLLYLGSWRVKSICRFSLNPHSFPP